MAGSASIVSYIFVRPRYPFIYTQITILHDIHLRLHTHILYIDEALHIRLFHSGGWYAWAGYYTHGINMC